MRPRILFWLLLALVAGFCSQAHAIDLLDAWRAARANDAYFAAAGNALLAGFELQKQGDAGVLPSITLDGGAKQSEKDYRAGRPPGNGKSSSGQQFSAALSLIAPIYNRSAAVYRDQSHRLSEQASVRYLIAEQDLILRTAKVYFDVLIAQESVKLVKAQSEAVKLQLAQARKMFEIGLASVTDQNDAQARYDAIVAAEIAAQNDLDVKENAFRLLTGLDSKHLQSISPARTEMVPPSSLAGLIDLAREENLNVRAQQLGLEVSRLEIDRFRFLSSPVLTLVATVGQQLDHGSISPSGGRDRTLSGVIGLQLSIPIFSGGARESRLRQAYALADQQINTLEGVRRDAEQQVQQYFLDMVNGSARVHALDQARVSAMTSVESSKLGRELGARTIVEVLNAEQAYFQTLYNFVVARYGVLFSRLQLAAATGSLHEAEIAEVNRWLTEAAVSGAPARR